jgi:hypothetical protein
MTVNVVVLDNMLSMCVQAIVNLPVTSVKAKWCFPIPNATSP